MSQWCRKVASGRRVAGAIRYLVNATGLQLAYARVLYMTLIVPVPMYGSERNRFSGYQENG